MDIQHPKFVARADTIPVEATFTFLEMLTEDTDPHNSHMERYNGFIYRMYFG